MLAKEVQAAAVFAEECLLGALLIEATDLNDDSAKEVSRILTPQDFTDAYQGRGLRERIYSAMCNCPHPDQVAVAEELNRQGKLQEGDCAYLIQLIWRCPMSLDYMHYAEMVRRYSEQRNPRRKTPEKWGIRID